MYSTYTMEKFKCKLLADPNDMCLHSTAIKLPKVFDSILESKGNIVCNDCSSKQPDQSDNIFWMCLTCGMTKCGFPSDTATHIGLHLRRLQQHKLAVKLRQYSEGFVVWCADCLTMVKPCLITNPGVNSLFLHIKSIYKDNDWIEKLKTQYDDPLLAYNSHDPFSGSNSLGGADGPASCKLTPTRCTRSSLQSKRKLALKDFRTCSAPSQGSPASKKTRVGFVVSPRRRSNGKVALGVAMRTRSNSALDESLLTQDTIRTVEEVLIEPRSDPQDFRGLTNMGSTCFLSVILQCLATSDKFVSCLLSTHQVTLKGNRHLKLKDFNVLVEPSNDPNNVRVILSFILEELRSCGLPRQPNRLIHALKVFTKENFNFEVHQDAQEVLLIIFSALDHELHEHLKRQLHEKAARREHLSNQIYQLKAPSTQIFMGQWEKVIYHCSASRIPTSSSMEPFTVWTLSIVAPRDVPSARNLDQNDNDSDSTSSSSALEDSNDLATIESCLDAYTAAREIDFKCSKKCSQTASHKTRHLVAEPPQHLILHLRRSKQTGVQTYEKVTTPVSFRPILDLAPHCSKKVQADPSPPKYRLYGVVSHSGSLSGGHYVAYLKVDRADGDTGQSSSQEPETVWCKCDDSDVSLTKEDVVFAAEPYLLFYKRLK